MIAVARRESAPASRWAVSPLPAVDEHDDDAVGPAEVETETDGVALVAAAMPEEAGAARTYERYSGSERLVWLSLHGGAGSTSLATVAGQGVVLDRAWPDPAGGWPARTALVCRTNAAGLAAAGQWLQEWAAGLVADLDLLALVAVADAPPRPSKAIRRRLHELSGAVPRLVTVPWIADWRDNPYTEQSVVTKALAPVMNASTKEN